MNKKFLIGFVFLIFLIVLSTLWVFNTKNTSKSDIYIKTGDNLDSLLTNLNKAKCINSEFTFNLARFGMGLKKVYPGKYIVARGMNNRALINMFKYGRQTDVAFRFGNNIFPNELYGALGKKFEADSIAFVKAINNSDKLGALSLDSASVLALFWSDTYKFPWTISPDKMVDYFVNDQQRFWNSERFNKLASTGLRSSKEVYIIASIIEKEAVKSEELPIMAGVYLNRLRIGMPLQADPTLKYAKGIKFMRRVTGILDTESPYNTYKYAGLPPGPIGLTTKKGIDAVLDFQEHDYLYFCAKEDRSGWHYFTKSYAEHLKNAAKYRAAMDERGIK